MIDIVENKIPVDELYKELYDIVCGGIVTFEGRIRKYSHRKEVIKITYECYYPMAIKIMNEIKTQAFKNWGINHIVAVHRIGTIPLGEVAVWIGIASTHRKEAFEACQFMIDEIKSKAPIWKHETYQDGSSSWVACHEIISHV